MGILRVSGAHAPGNQKILIPASDMHERPEGRRDEIKMRAVEPKVHNATVFLSLHEQESPLSSAAIKEGLFMSTGHRYFDDEICPDLDGFPSACAYCTCPIFTSCYPVM